MPEDAGKQREIQAAKTFGGQDFKHSMVMLQIAFVNMIG